MIICDGTGCEKERLEMLFRGFLTGITCWLDVLEVLRGYFVKRGRWSFKKGRRRG